MMNKQVKMYCVKLNLVRTNEEKNLCDLRNSINKRKYSFRKGLSAYVKKELNTTKWTKECSELFKEIITASKRYKGIEKELKVIKRNIHNLYMINKDANRLVKAKDIRHKDVISIGDNNLTRTMGLNLGNFTNKIITVKCTDMDNIIIDKVINNGLDIIVNKEINHYKFFSAGAGQTRTRKFLMILDDKELDKIMLSLMCGLTINIINAKGGINTNKFLAYLSLNSSGSTEWKDFDIDKCIVVDDFETMLSYTVDFINRKTNILEYKDKLNRKRNKEVAEWKLEKDKKMDDILIPHFDGLGLMLPSVGKGNIQFRLSWFKGLLTEMDYISYIKENNLSSIVPDVYGKEWDIIKDNIQVIFTKSQFKLYKFYSSWKEYKDNFKKYNCKASICLADAKEQYKDMRINYQMLQQLVNMEDKHIKILTTDFKRLIKRVHTDRNSQLDFLGATLKNNNRDNFQEALRIYPEMLNSAYVKKQISEKITAEKKKACSGKIKIKDSKRMFILSDPTAFCQWLFGNIDNPNGYLSDGEVYCNLYETESKLDILRSPSLSFEHVIRTNVRATKGKYKWFKTNGLYTSCHDIISKILAFDVDGDEALVLTTDWIIALVEDMINTYNIKPIYFTMGSCEPAQINNDNIAKNLLFVYNKSNIGKVSNSLTRLWNKENPMLYYDVMQKLCAYNNDVIDSAKTLDIPKLPLDIEAVIKNGKYPYFFQYAKDKKELECLPMSNSVMDRICKEIESIENNGFDYSEGFGAFKTKTLMNNKDIEVNKDIVKKYLELEKITTGNIDEYVKSIKEEDDLESDEDKIKTNFKEIYYDEAKKEFLNYCNENNIIYIDAVDMLIKYTYKVNDLKMAFMWNVFGDTIIDNINKNIVKPLDAGYMMCQCCGKRVKRESNNQLRCKSCSSKKSHTKSK